MKKILIPAETLLAVTSLLMSLWYVFRVAPVEQTMGDIQKIFYFHVPSAYIMYLSWLICAVTSALYLISRKTVFDHIANSASEIALVFASMVMISGPLWGRKAWGTYWVWDPRLTSALLLTLIIGAHVALRRMDTSESIRRFSAALAILGACIVPFIHLAVDKWRGHHPSVLREGGLDPVMAHVLTICMISFTVIYFILLHFRFCLETKKFHYCQRQETKESR